MSDRTLRAGGGAITDFSPDAVDRLLTEKLDFRTLDPARSVDAHGDHDLNKDWPLPAEDKLRPAAVLVPIVAYPGGARVLLTERPDHMSSHAGQVSFPGGRIEDHDDSAIAAALREADEEIGLKSDYITVRGTLDTYRTGTGFRITPVVAIVRPGFRLRLDPGEVAEAFEVPFAFLMDPANHERHSTEYQGKERFYYAMPYDGHYIWGATAGMIVNLHAKLFGSA